MIRPFEDIEEFKAVTGFKLGDVVNIRATDSKKYTYEFTGIFSGYEHSVDDTGEVDKWVVYIGAGMYTLDSLVNYAYLSTGGYQPLGVEYETKSEEYDNIEVKYHFEENGVYQAESGEVFTIHKRVEVDGVDWIVFRPDSKHGDLLIRVIFLDGESECFLAENEHGEVLLCEASNKVDEVKEGNRDEEQLDKEIAEDKEEKETKTEDDTVDFVFHLK